MKANTIWGAPNTGATNSSGFTGFPCGWRDYSDRLSWGFSNEGHWWSSSEANTANAFETCLLFNRCIAIKGFSPKNTGCTVRCVKD